MDLFARLGFQWDRAAIRVTVPAHPVEQVCLRFFRLLPEFAWDAGVLEGNALSLAAVRALYDGIRVGGYRTEDQDQILNLIEASRRLLGLVQAHQFGLSRDLFVELNGVVAHEEAFEWGVFRGEGQETNFSPYVALGEMGQYWPPQTEAGARNLIGIFERGVEALNADCSPLERGIAFFLFGALQQFFFDGNKRTSRFMMNGVLMSNGIDAISVPAARAAEFNEKMVRFYRSRDASEMMDFMIDCHPDADRIRSSRDTASPAP